MLSKEQRLGRKDFPRSVKNSLSFYGEFFTLRVYRVYSKSGGGQSRFVCVVSKKISPLATKRNLIRRQVYSVIQSLNVRAIQRIFVFFPKKEALSTPFSKLKADIVLLIEKACAVA